LIIPKERPYEQWKKKYWTKTASDSAINLTFIRSLDVSPLFAEIVWLQISAFDLTELGIGLLNAITPIDLEPYPIDFTYELPSVEETLQGIWANFEPVPYAKLYSWMTDYREYILENFEEEYQPDLLVGKGEKAIYGVTPYGRGLYDPVVAREFLRATFYKLRQIRTPDISWKTNLQQIQELLKMIEITDDMVWNRLFMIMSAQTNAFVLGLSVLGRSFLTETENGMGKVPIIDAQGNLAEIKFKTLDHLQIGFVLGVTPLGYGILLPKKSIYKLPNGKENPTIIKVLCEKINGMINRAPAIAWAYSNYNKPEEMRNFHKSEKADQYDSLMRIRGEIERWTIPRIPKSEQNPLRIRQYQNAVLQAICWRAKRHAWGFKAWESMTEEQFKDWWLKNWESQGLNPDVLKTLYEEMSIWVQHVRDVKTRIGQRLKQARKRLALSV